MWNFQGLGPSGSCDNAVGGDRPETDARPSLRQITQLLTRMCSSESPHTRSHGVPVQQPRMLPEQRPQKFTCHHPAETSAQFPGQTPFPAPLCIAVRELLGLNPLQSFIPTLERFTDRSGASPGRGRKREQRETPSSHLCADRL